MIVCAVRDRGGDGHITLAAPLGPSGAWRGEPFGLFVMLCGETIRRNAHAVINDQRLDSPPWWELYQPMCPECIFAIGQRLRET